MGKEYDGTRSDRVEELLKRVGAEFSDSVGVYPIPSQLNIRMLEIRGTGIYFTAPFDIMEELTEESVRKRIIANCDGCIEWLNGFKENCMTELEEDIGILKEMIELQKSLMANNDHTEYMDGLLKGMEMSLELLENKE